jgi:RHS repeat-associated protein
MIASNPTGLWVRLTALLLLAGLAFLAAPEDARADCPNGWCANAAEAYQVAEGMRQQHYDACAAQPPGTTCGWQALCTVPASDTRPLRVVLGEYQGQKAAMVVCNQWGVPGASYPMHIGVQYYPGDVEHPDCPDGTCNKEGNGLDAGTGNMSQVMPDVTDPRSDNRMGFSRAYSSNPMKVGRAVGSHWSHNFDRLINQVGAATTLTAERPNGRSNEYAKVSGAWVASGINANRLEEVLDASGVRINWRLTVAKDGSIETYSAAGQLQSIAYRDGYSQTMTYSTAATPAAVSKYPGYLLTVTDSYGRSMSLDYDSNGWLESVTAPDGKVTSYEHSAYGLLNVVRFPDGKTNTYGYTLGQLVSIKDEKNNVVATFSHDSGMRAYASTGAGATGPSYVYMGSTSSSTQTAMGATVTRQLVTVKGQTLVTSLAVSCPGCTTQTTTISYDANGYRDLFTDAKGIVTDTDFSSMGLLSQIIRAKSKPEQQVETWQWNTTFRVPSQIDKAGQRRVFTYDPLRGQLRTVNTIDTVTGAQRTTTFTYCEQPDVVAQTCPRVGLLRSIDGPRTDVTDTTNYTYYAADDATCATAPTTCPHRKGDLWKVTNALAQVREYLSYDGAGRVLAIRDANGLTINFEYDLRGRLSKGILRGDPSPAADAITQVNRDDAGLVSRVTLPDGTFLDFGYDPSQRLTDVTDGLGNTIHYTLDTAGNRAQEDTKDSSGAVKRTLARAFDALNDMRSVLIGMDGNGQVSSLIQFTYDAGGDLDHVTDPLSRVGDSDVDALGRLVQSISNSAGAGAERPVATFGYDARNNLVRITDPKGLNTTYAYNGFEELTQLVSPDTGTTIYGYNPAGLRISQTDANQVSSAFEYDALGRLTAHTFVADPSQNVYYDYDWTASKSSDCSAYANEQFPVGRLWRIRDESGSTRYCYDRYGNVARQIQTATLGSTRTTTTTYDNAGHIQAMTYPSGAIVVYLRDAAGNIRNLGVKPPAAAQMTLVSNVTYLPFGPIKQLTFGNGRVQTFNYDSSYGIDSVSDTALLDGLSEDYTLDLAGNVTGITEGGTAVRTYAYDGVDRLKSQKNGATTIDAFTYDATGNRLSKTLGGTTTTYTYAPTSHRLTKVGTQDRTYDANGNTKTIGTGLSFDYNLRNRRSAVKQSGLITRTFYYNGRGERVFVHYATPTNDVQFVYDETGHLLGEYNNAGYRITEYVWMGDRLVGVIRIHDGSTYQYVETDALGTPRIVVHPVTNKTIWRWNLADTSFGEHTADSDPDSNGISYAFNLRYPGQYYDGLAGISYNYYRDYDSSVGRYIESDPIGLGAGPSTYGYVGGNPLGGIDPFGLSEFDVKLIEAIYHNTVNDMTQKGQRLKNPEENNWNKFLGNSNLKKCGDQAEVVLDAMRHFADGKVGFEDTWHFQLIPARGHAWGRAWSENTSDPVLYFDPWADQFSRSAECSTCHGWLWSGSTENPDPPPMERK